MNQKYVTDTRDKTEETMLHDIMAAPVVSGFRVMEGLKQTSLCTKRHKGCKTHMRQTERQ
jgi:hypothetical protein